MKTQLNCLGLSISIYWHVLKPPTPALHSAFSTCLMTTQKVVDCVSNKTHRHIYQSEKIFWNGVSFYLPETFLSNSRHSFREFLLFEQQVPCLSLFIEITVKIKNYSKLSIVFLAFVQRIRVTHIFTQF